MSDAVSALNGARFTGFAQIEEASLCGMITVRGDLASAAMVKAISTELGAEMPAVNKVSFGTKGHVAWMSPDELLVVVAYEDANATCAALNTALADQHVLVVNVSDARAVFRISGDGAREVLAKLAPVDLSKDAFGTGDFRRTRLAQVAGAFWMNTDESLEIVCFRSVAQYVFDLFRVSAETGGEVGYI
ncbi:sarcosine oxidase subunit gamma [Shimia abyssi]|uniref:Sarcosine oxidase subunit gamma n=1 Tax=Shimia abyssi TaxID=1662395 RepID=A0A2P8FJ03_9RHOB|nr:sarcosine oxidase subunit gamma family protein [Shimia abyssi]PSL21696.1 sarcosine oxidase subunit gamma [Shimia abyssi]